MMLKSIGLTGILALAIGFVLTPERAEAQAPCAGLNYGYQFGVGISSNYLGHTRLLAPHDRPPHFALYPPVYYSDVLVRRPYGISPFAAPPGIRPVEMDMFVPAEPVTITNPYFDHQEASEEAELDAVNDVQADTASARQNGDVQFINNPFVSDQNWASIAR